jgi:GNAT superfamily N-acetyltransferase
MLIRPAEPDDVRLLHQFIVALAREEDFPGPVTARDADVAEALFGPRATAEAVVAVVDGERAGFALFYPTYSTIVGRPGIHLEDLYVQPDHRGGGVGRALLAHLADLALSRGGARLEWAVLRTNEAALRFYDRLHAREVDEIATLRLDGEALRELGTSVEQTGSPAVSPATLRRGDR